MVRHLKEGENFGDSPDHFPSDFGFSGSSKPDSSRHAVRKAEGGETYGPRNPDAKPRNRATWNQDKRDGGDKPAGSRVPDKQMPELLGDMSDDERHNFMSEKETTGDTDWSTYHATNPAGRLGGKYARGGAPHIHPFGHQVADVEQHGDGGMTYHHAHGGSTHIAPNGGVTHHDHTGAPMHGDGGEQGMVREAAQLAQHMKRHEAAEAQEERAEGEGYAMGGPRRPPVPHGRHMAPRMPMKMGDPAAKGQVTGGALPYGVGASDEPAIAGSGQGLPGLAKGGAGRKRRS